MSTSLALVVLLGVSTTGFHDHGARKVACCEGCGGQPSSLQNAIRVLRTSPKWKARDDAADALRKFDWRRHPEAVLALCDALLLDPKDDVREEAAESLKKMAPCVPMAHAALSQAAASDPEDDVREEARDALKSIGKRCVVECQVCGPPTAGAVVHGPAAIPPDWMPILAPDRGAFPSPAPVPDTSPVLEAIPPTTIPPTTVPNASPLSDTPPPPPTPYVPAGPVSSRGRSRVR